MICYYCRSAFNHDDKVAVMDDKLFHQVECLMDYVLENMVDEAEITYLEYLENLVGDLLC